MSFRKNPTARTVRKKQKGFRTNLGVTTGAGIKSKEDRAKTHAGGNAKETVKAEQHKAKKKVTSRR